jgi:hypothetical protein
MFQVLDLFVIVDRDALGKTLSIESLLVEVPNNVTVLRNQVLSDVYIFLQVLTTNI